MKPSRYNVVADDPASGQTVIFNTLTRALARCDAASAPKAEALLATPSVAADNDPMYAAMLKQRFIVADDLDELAIVINRKRAGAADPNRLDVIIMPTLACDFRCTYCFEDHPTGTMSKEVQESVARWMDQAIPQHKLTIVHWYGGEPLLDLGTVTALNRHAVSVAQNAGVALTAHATTNGFALSESRIRQLIDAGVLGYQITLDGAPDAHNRLRVLQNGGATFNRIFENILLLVRADPRVAVTVRINFNNTNMNTIPDLLRMFPADVRPRLRVVFEPIFGDDTTSATGTIPAQDIGSAMAQDYALAKELGFDVQHGTSQITPRLVYCYAERQHQLIINHTGDVFKCSVGKFRPQERVGYLDGQGNLVKDEARWNEYAGNDDFEPRCRDCVFLPVCLGGCRRARITAGNTGSQCALIPTNATAFLKNIATGTVGDFLCAACRSHAC